LFKREREFGLVNRMRGFCPDVVAVMLGDNELGSGMRAAGVFQELQRLREELERLLQVKRFCFVF
jgi:hypothetical protein